MLVDMGADRHIAQPGSIGRCGMHCGGHTSLLPKPRLQPRPSLPTPAVLPSPPTLPPCPPTTCPLLHYTTHTHLSPTHPQRVEDHGAHRHQVHPHAGRALGHVRQGVLVEICKCGEYSIVRLRICRVSHVAEALFDAKQNSRAESTCPRLRIRRRGEGKGRTVRDDRKQIKRQCHEVDRGTAVAPALRPTPLPVYFCSAEVLFGLAACRQGRGGTGRGATISNESTSTLKFKQVLTVHGRGAVGGGLWTRHRAQDVGDAGS